jgi:multiple sugar transport system substrate-binding protein
MVADGTAVSASTVDSGWGGEALGNGRAAMVMEGNWVIQFMLDNYPNTNWGVAELPASPDGGRATMVYTVCYGVNPKSKNLDAAWTLANFLTGKEGAKLVAESGFGVLPGRASASEAWTNTWTKKLGDLKRESLSTQLGAFLKGAEYARPWQLPAGWNAFNDAFNASLQEAYAGNKLVDDVLTDVTKVADELAAK